MHANDSDGNNAGEVMISSINGKQFVSGLFWQPLTRPRAYLKEAREIGKREGMDIVAIRRSAMIMQAGFVAKDHGVFKGMYSLAATLVGILGDSWIGVFELDNDKYAFVAVNEGAIIPGCDIVGYRKEVYESLNRTYSLFNSTWDKVYAPGDFDFGGEALDVKTLLVPSALKREYQLKQLAFGMTLKELVTAIVLASTLAGAAMGYHHWSVARDEEIRQKSLEVERDRLEKLVELNARSHQVQTVHALEHPWAKSPSTPDFLSGCLGAINQMPLFVGGWGFDSAKCARGHVDAAYKRVSVTGSNGDTSGKSSTETVSGPTVSNFVVAARAAFKVDPAILDGGEGATVSLPLNLMFGGDDALQLESPLLIGFTSHFQAIDVKPKLDEKVVAPKPKALPGQPQPAAEPAPDWKTYTFVVDSGVTPEIAFQGLNTSGVRLTEISVALGQDGVLTWHVAGEIYAK